MIDSANTSLDAQLKRVLRFMPAPVGIVTSFDPEDGTPVGLAMSALMPVCLEPPAMAICVNRSGSAHDAMVRSGKFCINLLTAEQAAHMTPFANAKARDSRFTQADWQQHGRIWYIEGSPASIFCTIRERVAFGTHDLLVGEVDDMITSGSDDIVGWANGSLCRPAPLS